MKTTFKTIKLVCTALSITVLSISCEQDRAIEELSLQDSETQKNLSRKQINDFIFQTTKSTNNSFNWTEAPEDVVWSALVLSDYEVMVGYQKEGWNEQTTRDYMFESMTAKTRDNQLDEIKNNLLSEVVGMAKNKSASTENILVEEKDELLSMIIKIDNIETLRNLRASNNIRYIEPMYDPHISSDIQKNDGDLGCAEDNPRYDLRLNYDYINLAPGGKMGWNFRYHKIKETWEWGGIRDKGTGKGIGVAILDTGLSNRQLQLVDTYTGNEYAFNEGYVTGRSISFYDWYGNNGSSPIDDCGHGTALSGVIASPRGKYGIHGVAYGANLYNYRANSDVFIYGATDIAAVSNAFISAANTSNVRIISMSMGAVTRSERIADAIVYAYRKGKLIFAAAGTTKFGSYVSGQYPNLATIVFPANMTDYDGDVVYGVTGIKTDYSACNDCVKGRNVDFAIVMEQKNGTQALSTGLGGLYPTTIGGSSVATATMAGIAALVWSKDYTRPRAEIIDALKRTADYPFRTNPIFGYGKPNAYEAYKYPFGF